MALTHRSIATIDSPEFINLQPIDINPLMSSCEIKVFYLGQNRNRSFISKQVATEMAKSLRGAPIVGYYKEQKQDFRDHGDQMIWDESGIHFNCLTKPYGFVSPDAKVWFQKFVDTDQFGNEIEREYLMTTGYLWTGQFEEADKVIQQGKPHSMELDSDKLEGHWATDNKSSLEFFIISDAIFSKLCILGDDVEPCFEGSSITAPQISKSFSKNVDNNFRNTLFSMLKDLEYVLKGGSQVNENEKEVLVGEQADINKEFTQEQSETDTANSTEAETDFDKKEEKDEEEKKAPTEHKKEEEQDKEQEKDEAEAEGEDKKDDDEDKDKKYALLEQQYSALKNDYDSLKVEYQALVEFKENIENQQKDALIDEFYMLSDEDKRDVITNKTKYTIDEIKAKLAVICFEKKVNFSSINSDENDSKVEDEQPVVTFNLESQTNEPAWMKAVENVQKNI